MIGNTKGAIGRGLLAALALGAWTEGHAAAYATMAPVAQYLMADRNAEIAMARSAAPPAISDAATVLVLGRGGYETAVKGKNGFVCLVERSWMSPFDFPQFWNARMRGPICYNPPAARSILPYTVKRTALALAGQSKAQMLEATKAAVARKELPTPEPGAMSYMMSRQQYLNDAAGAWHPHLMFHVPKAEAASWGANLPGSPVMLDTDHVQMPEPETIFMVGLGKWSDGAPVVATKAHSH
ncbi:hypothetical protein [Phenylobacterium sp.]|uniref:hypothetical protein n=1 Tax=Phenylobacterium sp. TaxID=1871053 RepID=UPI002DEA8B05|nr:hypothetical protein [Phenylobacterium sp.]